MSTTPRTIDHPESIVFSGVAACRGRARAVWVKWPLEMQKMPENDGLCAFGTAAAFENRKWDRGVPVLTKPFDCDILD